MNLKRCLAAAAVLVVASQAHAQLADGKYVLATVAGSQDSTICILKVETKNGRPTATAIFSPPSFKIDVRDLKVSGKDVTFTVTQTRSVQGQTFKSELPFFGTIGSDSKVILGSMGADRAPARARLSATDKDALEASELTVRSPSAEAMRKVATVTSRAQILQNRVSQEKDPEKRKSLLAEMTAARQEAAEKTPGMYREIVKNHPGTPAATDAALNLLRNAAASKLTAEETAGLIEAVRKGAEPYGQRYARATLTTVAETLVRTKGLEAAALAAIEPVAKGLTDADPANTQSRVLTTYKTALERAGRAKEAKELEPRLARIEAALDTEYLASVPPFKPAKYAGRKEKGATQLAVLELFTGAQCPPCVAADVAFDALQKAYAPTDLVLIQYHMHIPGPDPLTNPDTIARWDYYRSKFAGDVRGTPTTVFNGKPQAGGGGNMANARRKYDQYTGIIDEILEKTTDIRVGGSARIEGDRVSVTVEIAGMKEPKDSVKLRLILVEESVKYVGSNGLRFHHQVVRSLFGAPNGVAVKDLKGGKHSAMLALSEVRQGLTKYLDEYAAQRPFPNPARPLDLKELKVIALVQNDATGEVLQAAQFDVAGAATE